MVDVDNRYYVTYRTETKKVDTPFKFYVSQALEIGDNDGLEAEEEHSIVQMVKLYR